MSPASPAICTHDVGPGTTVCLRCRQEKLQAARARERVLLLRAAMVAAALFLVYVVGTSAMNAWRGMSRRSREEPSRVASMEVTPQGAVRSQPLATSPARVSVATSTAAPAATASPSSSAAAPLAIVAREGRTELADSVIVERTGDSVVVDFDTQLSRTRRSDKFERIVRQTLPGVYGQGVDSTLARIPDGGIVGGADLVHDLPTRGIHLPLRDGWTLDIWPETRAGRDGPLVVSYRTRLSTR